jgi:hypothetical protein
MLAEIPAIIDGDVTIHIGPGTYNEVLDILDHVRVGVEASVSLVGDPADPASVVLDGTGFGQYTGIDIEDSDAKLIGLTIQNYGEAVSMSVGGGWLEVTDCRILNNSVGVMAVLGGDIEISNTIISGHTDAGVQALGSGVIEIGQGTEISNNPGGGVLAWMGGLVNVEDVPCTFLNNDLVASEHSTIQGYGVCTLTSSSCVAGDPSGHCVP